MEEFIVAIVSTAVLMGFRCSALPITVLTGILFCDPDPDYDDDDPDPDSEDDPDPHSDDDPNPEFVSDSDPDPDFDSDSGLDSGSDPIPIPTQPVSYASSAAQIMTSRLTTPTHGPDCAFCEIRGSIGGYFDKGDFQ
ncbi:hypothetical protein L3X38_030420 [Prunus dulcis]|uniref:Uncharacterized protein n=1 Tax=Prunus dulcis TaxID=3755 RepID=A0AAD4VBE3_PRUDU|nr:hypothetical protein L3X38_030420 [Prunus dulcis]